MNKKEYYSVSRIEGDIAVLEFSDRTFNDVDMSLLPDNIREGNVLTINENGDFTIDKDEEIRRKKRLLELQNKIFE